MNENGFCPRCAVFWGLVALTGWLGLRWARGEDVSSGVLALAATVTAYHGVVTWVGRHPAPAVRPP